MEETHGGMTLHWLRIPLAALCALAVVLSVLYALLSFTSFTSIRRPGSSGAYSDGQKFQILKDLATSDATGADMKKQILDQLRAPTTVTEQGKLDILRSLQH